MGVCQVSLSTSKGIRFTTKPKYHERLLKPIICGSLRMFILVGVVSTMKYGHLRSHSKVVFNFITSKDVAYYWQGLKLVSSN